MGNNFSHQIDKILDIFDEPITTANSNAHINTDIFNNSIIYSSDSNSSNSNNSKSSNNSNSSKSSSRNYYKSPDTFKENSYDNVNFNDKLKEKKHLYKPWNSDNKSLDTTENNNTILSDISGGYKKNKKLHIQKDTIST
jgi:hypothetical protein